MWDELNVLELQTVDSYNQNLSRLQVDYQNVLLEKSTLTSRIDVLTEQQASLQTALNQQTGPMQQWHLRDVN